MREESCGAGVGGRGEEREGRWPGQLRSDPGEIFRCDKFRENGVVKKKIQIFLVHEL